MTEVIPPAIREVDISVKGLFMNADGAGFDSKEFRDCCEKKEINASICFNKRNGESPAEMNILTKNSMMKDILLKELMFWLDSFRSLFNRFDITKTSWIDYNYLPFMVIAIKKFNTKKFK